MRVKLIYNPAAGDNEQPSSDELLDLIRRAGYQVDYQSAAAPNWAKSLEEPMDLVAVAGGDGMVGRVVKRLLGRPVPLAIIPIGTANNVATTLGLTGKPMEELIMGWKAARHVQLDIGVATGPWGCRYFIEGLGAGLFTETMRRLDKRGNVDLAQANHVEEKLMSVLELLKHRLRRFRPRELRMTFDDYDLSGEYILVEALNIGCVGPNLYLAPQADPSDGLFDLVSVKKSEADRLARYLTDCIEGKVCAVDLNVRRGKHLRIDWEGSPVHIDDEAWPQSDSTTGKGTKVIDARLNPDCVELLLPS